MARITDPTPEQEAGYAAWVAARPESVRVVAERFTPWDLYRMKSTGHRVTIASFGEQQDGRVTLTVSVRAEFNAIMFERNVFGIDPDDLEPCELPSPDEHVGAVLTQDEAIENMDTLREMAGIEIKH